MRYFNQAGERVSNKDAEQIFLSQETYPEIKGWAIDVANNEPDDLEEFIRLWGKLRPHPLYKEIPKPIS